MCQPRSRCPLATGAMKATAMNASGALFSSVASSWMAALWMVCKCQTWPRSIPARPNSGSVSRRRLRISGAIRRRSISQRPRLPEAGSTPHQRVQVMRTAHRHQGAQLAELRRADPGRALPDQRDARDCSPVVAMNVTPRALFHNGYRFGARHHAVPAVCPHLPRHGAPEPRAIVV
jgi:hypothetical protein